MNDIGFSPRLIDKGIEVAKEAYSRAYAPYSGFNVSVALYLPLQEEFIPGVNVENLSYGGTICAERSAATAAISRYGKTDFGFLVLYTEHEPLTPPCGICRQFLSEFCGPDFPVIMINHLGQRKDVSFGELLPMPFEDF